MNDQHQPIKLLAGIFTLTLRSPNGAVYRPVGAPEVWAISCRPVGAPEVWLFPVAPLGLRKVCNMQGSRPDALFS